MSRSKCVLAAIAFLSLLTAATKSEAAGSPFDGEWSVVIQTSAGKCGIYRAAVQIAGGQVMSREGDYAVSGRVSPNGATAVTVMNENGSASGTGRLSASSGSGKWRSSSGECSGTWTATRRQF